MSHARSEVVPTSYLSASRIKVYLQCPRKYFLQYVRGIEPAWRPVPLLFGSSFHTAVDAWLQKDAVTADAVKNIFRQSFTESVEHSPIPVLFDEGDDLTKSTVLGEKMLEVFLDRVPMPRKVYGVEVAFEVNLDPELPPVIGSLDAIVEEEDGRTSVWELKTSKRKYSGDQLTFDLQPTVYARAVQDLGLVADVVMLVTTKTAKPDVQVERLTRGRSDFDDLLATAWSVRRAIDAGVDHPVRSAMCRGCPFVHACL